MPEETSYVNIDGVVDRYGSAKLKGSVDSANPKRYADFDLQFRNLSINSYSPYSANFAGRKIDEGKLYLDLGYNIVDSQLRAENSIIIKKIKLGDEVESKEAVSLPLGLAIALLEDSEGVIDIDMPVEGDVDSPDFKYGALVWKALGNLITKAVTAPFRFLGALLGIEGEKLETIEFDPGYDILLPPEQEKLDTLAKALKKRPKLLLGVAGGYDPAADARVMKAQKVKAAAMALLRIQKGAQKGEILTLPVLETLYTNMRGEKALGIIQDNVRKEQKDVSTFVLRYKQRLLDVLTQLQEIREEELSALAASRAQKIMTYLSTAQGIAAERMQARETQTGSDASGRWVKSKLSIEIK